MGRAATSADGYALKLANYGMLTGASMAIRAISDGVLILHTGVGCKYKGAAQQARHDRALAPHQREGYTEVTDQALIKGSARHIGPYARSWQKRRSAGFMAVTPANFLVMAGEDIAGEVRKTAGTLPCPLELIPCPGDRGDLYAGYAEVVRRVLSKIPFRSTTPKPGRVAVAGFLFDRYEADTAANLAELRGLLRLAGLDAAPPLMSGMPFSALCEAADAERVIRLPYAGPSEEIARITGRPVVEAGLPIGVSGTFQWLRRIADSFGRGGAQIEAWIRSQAGAARPRIDQFRGAVSSSLGHRRAAVFADTPLAAGICGLLIEAGVSPRLVGFRDETLGHGEFLAESLRDLGLALPKDAEVVVNPPVKTVRDLLAGMLERDELGVVAGSSCEIRLARRVVQDRLARTRPDPRRVPLDYGPLLLEIGFPSDGYHVIADQPYFGIRGALNLVQRLNAGLRG